MLNYSGCDREGRSDVLTPATEEQNTIDQHGSSHADLAFVHGLWQLNRLKTSGQSYGNSIHRRNNSAGLARACSLSSTVTLAAMLSPGLTSTHSTRNLARP